MRVFFLITLLFLFSMIPIGSSDSGRDSNKVFDENLAEEYFVKFFEGEQPLHTIAHPNGGLLSIFQVTEDYDSISIDIKNSLTTVPFSSENINLNVRENCTDWSGILITWIKDDGSIESSQLDFSDFPIFHSEIGESYSWDNGFIEPCHYIRGIFDFRIRDDGLVGFMIQTEADYNFDWMADETSVLMGFTRLPMWNNTSDPLYADNTVFDWTILQTYWDFNQTSGDYLSESLPWSETSFFDFYSDDMIVFAATSPFYSGDDSNLQRIYLNMEYQTYFGYFTIGDSYYDLENIQISENNEFQQSYLFGARYLQCEDLYCRVTGTIVEFNPVANFTSDVMNVSLIIDQTLDYASVAPELEFRYDDYFEDGYPLTEIGKNGKDFFTFSYLMESEVDLITCGEAFYEKFKNDIPIQVSVVSDFSGWSACAIGVKLIKSISSDGHGNVGIIGNKNTYFEIGNYSVSNSDELFYAFFDQDTGVISSVGTYSDDDETYEHKLISAGGQNFYTDLLYNDQIAFFAVNPDMDSDSVPDFRDNCQAISNSNQNDGDQDGYGDECDDLPGEATQWSDIDGDGFGDNPQGYQADRCPTTPGTSTEDRYGCWDYDGDGWSNPILDNPNSETYWDHWMGADQQPNDPNYHLDEILPIDYNVTLNGITLLGNEIEVVIEWSQKEINLVPWHSIPDYITYLVAPNSYNDCYDANIAYSTREVASGLINSLQSLNTNIEFSISDYDSPPLELVNNDEYLICIIVSDANGNERIKGPFVVTPYKNQAPNYAGGLINQNIEYGKSWNINLCDYFNDGESPCSDLDFTASSPKISINDNNQTATWAPTSSENILQGVVITTTDSMGQTASSNEFTIEVLAKSSTEDVLFSIELPIVGDFSMNTEEVLGTIGSILAFMGTVGLTIVRMRSSRKKKQLVKDYISQIQNSGDKYELEEIESEIEDSLESGKITDDQYNTLSIRLNSTRTKLSDLSPTNQERKYQNSPPPQVTRQNRPHSSKLGEFGEDGYEYLEYPVGSDIWFYRDPESGQWMEYHY